MQRRINILPTHFLRGLQVAPEAATNEQIDEYIRIAVFDDVKYVLHKAKKLDVQGPCERIKEVMNALGNKQRSAQEKLDMLAELIPLVNGFMDELGAMQPYFESKHQQDGQEAMIAHPHRTTRYATKPLDGYSHTALSTGKPEGIKWGNAEAMWSQFAQDVGPGVAQEEYGRVEAARLGLPLTQLPWEEAKRILPRPLINLIFDVRYQLESQDQVVVDERTPYELGRKEKSPHAPGTLRSWHQDSKGVLPRGQRTDESPPLTALHQHYEANSQTGAGSSIEEGVEAPQGLAEYTGTGSNWEHQTKIVLDYVSSRVYLTLTHYQYWALVPKGGGEYEFWDGNSQKLDLAQGKLNKDFREQDVEPILMSPWMEILMPTADSLGKARGGKGKGKSKRKGPVVNDSAPSSSGIESNVVPSSSGKGVTSDEQDSQSEHKQLLIDKKLEESSSSDFDLTSEDKQQAQEMIQSAGMQPKTPELQPSLQVSKEGARTTLRDNARTLPPSLQTLMALAIPAVIVAILYILFAW